jgi:WD40 repeat protein
MMIGLSIAAVPPAVAEERSGQAILQLRPDGPIAAIHALQFSSDGKALLAAGDEKLVQVWVQEEGKFVRSHSKSLRHWIGPGPLGSIKAMAVSDSPPLIAIGGVGTFTHHAGFADDGIMIPSFGWSQETLEEIGTVSVFDPQQRIVHRIKTHPGYVQAAQIVSLPEQKTSYLITVGNDQDPTRCETKTESTSVDRSLRIFRIPDGKQMSKWQLPPATLPSKLIAWTDRGTTDFNSIGIAVTTADGKRGSGINFYRPDSDKPIQVNEPFGLAVDHLPQSKTLCASTLRGLVIYNQTDATEIKRIDLRSQLSSSQFIYSLRSILSRPDLVVITTRDLGRADSEHHLHVVNLSSGRIVSGEGISIGRLQNPVLATDPTGQFVAATADVAGGLQIFRIDRLLQADRRPTQKIQSEFQPVRRATVRSVDGVVELVVQFQQKTDSAIFTLKQNKFQRAKNQSWNSADEPVSFQNIPQKKQFVASTTLPGVPADKVQIDTTIPPLGKLIRSALLDQRPLLAVAYLQHGGESQPTLSLFDPISGAELRRLNGHQQFVTAIEFSSDHKYLTSVSSDGLVCVWKLTDLDKLIGRRATLSGYRWCVKNDRITVIETVDPDPDNQLQVGDQITAIISDAGQVESIDSPEHFFRLLSTRQPMTDLRVRINRNERALTVVVKLSQAADERKPLFSFICKEHEAIPQWLAWTPGGPFQSCGAEIERSAGWHFNPQSAEQMAKFAPFQQYRDQFMGDGLVDRLLAIGRLPDVWPPPIEMDVASQLIDIDGNHARPEAGEFRVDAKPDKIQISTADLPFASVDGVVGQVDDEKPFPLVRSELDPDIWIGELQQAMRADAKQDFTVRIKSKRLRDGIHRKSWTMNPSKPIAPNDDESGLPAVQWIAQSDRTELKRSELRRSELPEQEIRVEAMLDAATIPADSQFKVIRGDEEFDLAKLRVVGNRVSGTIPLQPGRNHIRLKLENSGAVSTSPPVEVVLLDPPSIESVDGQVDPKNRASLALKIRSTSKLDRDNFRVLVGGVPYLDWKLSSPSDTSGDQFLRFTISSLVVAEGENSIEIQLVDSDRQQWDQQSISLIGSPQPKQPLLKMFLANDGAFESDVIEVAAEVTSDDLEEVRCQVGSRRVPVSLSRIGNSSTQLIKIAVPLDTGLNHISMSAISASGLVTTVSRRVSRIPRPVEIVVTQVEGKNVSPINFSSPTRDAFVADKPISIPRGTLRGFVRVSKQSDQIPRSAKVIRAWVNGFLQSVVPLRSSGNGNELHFNIPILLSAKQNAIQLDLPGLAEADDSIADIKLDCVEPSRDQTLHLLVISTQVSLRQRKEYEAKVLRLLGIEDGKMPSFSKVIAGSPVYPALTGSASRSDSVRQLVEQCRFELSGKQGVNSTVLIYFHGQEFRSGDGKLCLMTMDARPERAFQDSSLITSAYLGKQLQGLKCANLIFLDVTEHPDSHSTPFTADPAEPQLGFLRLNRYAGGQPHEASSPLLLNEIQRVMPRVGQLDQLARELRNEVQNTPGLAISESIPATIRWMRFGELATP